jgi:ATP-dependent Lhr-like helicase
MGASELQEVLWDAVARGLVSSDGFQTLRALLGPRSRWQRRPATARRGLRQGAGGSVPNEGRWALWSAPTHGADADELAEAVAEQLLARWGVVFRDLIARETLVVPWREVIWALRRLEARGLVRGGRFVGGFVGEQYALPEAVELLRAVRRSERTGVVVRVSACDPLNLVGIVTPGPRVSSIRTNFVRYRDGAPIESDAQIEERARLDGSLGTDHAL